MMWMYDFGNLGGWLQFKNPNGQDDTEKKKLTTVFLCVCAFLNSKPSGTFTTMFVPIETNNTQSFAICNCVEN